MGTKTKPRERGYHETDGDGAPMFILYAHDESAPALIETWATMRFHEILDGDRPRGDVWQILDALECVEAMKEWRSKRAIAE